MKIPFDAIVESGVTLEINDAEWFPEDDWSRVGPVHAKLFLTRQLRRVIVDGHLHFTCCFVCDSCLEPYEEVQDFPFKVELEYLAAADPYWQSDEQQCSPVEMDVEVLREPEVDIESLLAQQVIVSVPVKRLCSQSCRGLCPTCGINLNKEECLCRGLPANSPFQVLAQLQGKG